MFEKIKLEHQKYETFCSGIGKWYDKNQYNDASEEMILQFELYFDNSHYGIIFDQKMSKKDIGLHLIEMGSTLIKEDNLF